MLPVGESSVGLMKSVSLLSITNKLEQIAHSIRKLENEKKMNDKNKKIKRREGNDFGFS